MGPFEVVEKTGPHTYRLALPSWMKIHDNINVRRLSPWKGNEVNGMTPAPPEPEIIDGEEYYEIEQIIDSRVRWGKLRFLVRWAGYDESHDTWERADEIEERAGEAVEDFYQRHPNAPKKIAATLFRSLPWRALENLTEVEVQSLGHRL